jgi:hypothetical protein
MILIIHLFIHEDYLFFIMRTADMPTIPMIMEVQMAILAGLSGFILLIRL